MNDRGARLRSDGFVRLDGGFRTAAEAFELARSLIELRHGEDGLDRLSIIGDFVLGPVGGVRDS